MVIHVALLVAVHAQPVAAVTATLPVTAVEATLVDGADRVGAHVAPAWVMVNVLPPIVRVPVRARAVGIGGNHVAHRAIAGAARARADGDPRGGARRSPGAARGAVTVTLAVVPAATALAEGAEMLGAHAAPSWVTVKVSFAIVRVPVRLVEPTLAATLKVTEPDPEPAAPALIVIQGALLWRSSCSQWSQSRCWCR